MTLDSVSRHLLPACKSRAVGAARDRKATLEFNGQVLSPPHGWYLCLNVFIVLMASPSLPPPSIDKKDNTLWQRRMKAAAANKRRRS